MWLFCESAPPANRLQPLLIGTSRDLEVGQKVFAIGNPFGLDQTLTTGIISGLGRQIKARTGRVIDGVSKPTRRLIRVIPAGRCSIAAAA